MPRLLRTLGMFVLLALSLVAAPLSAQAGLDTVQVRTTPDRKSVV